MVDTVDAAMPAATEPAPFGAPPYAPPDVPAPPVFQAAPPAVPMQQAPPAMPLPAPPGPVFKPAPPALALVPPPPPEAPPAPLPQQAIENQQQAGAAKVATSKLEAEQAAQQEQQAKVTQTVTEQAIKLGEEHRQQAQDAFNAAVADYSKAKIQDFWTGASTGMKIQAGVALAFGAFGAGLSAFGGHPTGNLAAEQLNRNIERDFERQRANIELLKDRVMTARLGVADADKWAAQKLTDVNAKQVAAYNAVMASGAAKLKAAGVPSAEIAANGEMIQLRQAQAAVVKQQGEHDEDRAMKHATNEATVAELHARATKQLAEAGKLGRHGSGGGGSGLAVLGADGKPTGETAATKAEAAARHQALVREAETKGKTDAAAATAKSKTDAVLAAKASAAERLDGRLGNLQAAMKKGNRLEIKQAQAQVKDALSEFGKSARWNEKKIENASEEAGVSVRNLLPKNTPLISNGSEEISSFRALIRKEAGVAGPKANAAAEEWAKAHPDDPRAAKILAKIGG